jgi:hypothetical protein
MPKAKKHQATEEDLVRELDELGREFNHLMMEGNKMAKDETEAWLFGPLDIERVD